MSGAMFIKTGGRLVRISEEPYELEDDLQAWVAEYPDLLAGEQMDPQSPRRFLFVAREVGIPSAEDEGERWSLDHLFVDQDGVPTLVEVKRSTDTRLRREVVGQMLDYAANAAEYLTPAKIAEVFATTCVAQGVESAERLAEFLGQAATEAESFWELVGENLRTGRVRLVFVADAIPRELRRIILFLNSLMNPTEVWGVEVKKYEGDFADQDIVTFVSRVVGQPKADTPRAARPSRKWDKASVLAELAKNVGQNEYEAALELIQWAEEHMDALTFGRGAYNGSVIPMVRTTEAGYTLFAVWTGGVIEMQFGSLLGTPGFDEDVVREFARRVSDATGVAVPPGRETKFPSFPLAALANREARERFIGALEWALERVPR